MRAVSINVRSVISGYYYMMDRG